MWFDGKLITIKSPTDFNTEEMTAYNEALKEGNTNEYALLKASLCLFFKIGKYFYLDGSDGSTYELTDAAILRTWSDKHLQESYTISIDYGTISAPTKKYKVLPSYGSELFCTNFDKMLDCLE